MRKYICQVLLLWSIGGFAFTISEKAFAQATQEEDQVKSTDSATTPVNGNSTYVTGITAGRARALAGAAVGLISLIVGWHSKLRSRTNAGRGRTGAIVAVVLGLTGIILSIVHLSITAGAVFGSGSGKAGAIVALVPASIGLLLGGLVLRGKNKTE